MRVPRLELPAVAALLACGFGVLAFPLSDYDYFWHLRTGYLILETGSIPTTDPFSFTAAGQPWVVQGWLFDLCTAWVHRSFGDTGVRAFFVAWLLATWSVVQTSVRLFVADRSRALAITLLSAAGAATFFVARPVAATLLGFALTLFLLLKYRCSGHARWLMAIPPVMAVWVNLHFGFVTGLGLIVLTCVADFLSRWMPIDGASTAKGSLTPLRCLLLIAASVAALGLNPIGYDVVATTINMTGTNSASGVIEWHSPDFRLLGAQAFLAVAGLTVVARTMSRTAADWLDIVLLAAMTSAALYSMRHMPLASIAMAPLMARALAGWAVLPWENRWSERLPIALRRSAGHDLGDGVHALNWSLTAVAAVGLLLAAPAIAAWRDARVASIVPVQATRFLEASDLQGRILNDYEAGGYLIHRLYPKQRVFVDGRYNPYAPDVIADYERLRQLGAGWLDTIDRYRVDVILTRSPGLAFSQALIASSRFRLVYADPYFGVLIRNDGRRPDLGDVVAPPSLPHPR